MKKMMGVLIALTFAVLASCASYGTADAANPSSIVVTRTNSYASYWVKISVDGKNFGKVGAGKSKTFHVSNGSHTVTAIFEAGETESLLVELNNQRCELMVVYEYSKRTLKIVSTVSLSTPSSPQSSASVRDTAVSKSFDTLHELISDGSKIAILDIAPNNDESSYIGEELTIKFVNSKKYIMVDRQTLETIRQEQRFQMAGEVSDGSAVSIGQFLGADVVITGTITGNNNQRRLRLRALNVKTAQILAMSSESI